MLIVLTTTPDKEEAASLAKEIVSARLAACVQILPAMTSVYFWEGELQEESEHLLLIKTSSAKFDELRNFILENHSYEIPEIVGIPADMISESYRRWLEDYLTAS